jgi:hypothetical protein
MRLILVSNLPNHPIGERLHTQPLSCSQLLVLFYQLQLPVSTRKNIFMCNILFKELGFTCTDFKHSFQWQKKTASSIYDSTHAWRDNVFYFFIFSQWWIEEIINYILSNDISFIYLCYNSLPHQSQFFKQWFMVAKVRYECHAFCVHISKEYMIDAGTSQRSR